MSLLFFVQTTWRPHREVLIASGVNTRRGDNTWCGECGGGETERRGGEEREEMKQKEEEEKEEEECIVTLLLSRDLFMVSRRR